MAAIARGPVAGAVDRNLIRLPVVEGGQHAVARGHGRSSSIFITGQPQDKRMNPCEATGYRPGSCDYSPERNRHSVHAVDLGT